MVVGRGEEAIKEAWITSERPYGKKGRSEAFIRPDCMSIWSRPRLIPTFMRSMEYSPDPHVIKFAKMFANYLDNKTIFITDHAQLVGYVGSLPHTVAWLPSVGSPLNVEVLNDATAIPEPMDESLKIINDVIAFWSGKADADRMAPMADLDDLTKILSGAIVWGVPLARGGYSGKNYEYFMTGERAFEDIIAELDKQLDEAYELVHTPIRQ